jgi:hypothetical protein
MDCNFPFLIRRYSTFRNDLPSLVWQRYFTKASSAPVVITLQVKMSDEIDLCFPALRFESALADVVVAGRIAMLTVLAYEPIGM